MKAKKADNDNDNDSDNDSDNEILFSACADFF